MISWFKKHFIPHEENNHRPHLLRNKNIRNVVFVVLLVEVITFLGPTLSKIKENSQMAAVLPAILSSLTNDERQAQNVEPLVVNQYLNKAAELKAQDMATYGYFAHTSPSGKTPWYWLEQVGYNYQYAGENLAINFVDSKDVTNAWMASPTHKANIVKGNYTEIGTGIATGMYEGRETIFVAQVYANPIVKKIKTNAEKMSIALEGTKENPETETAENNPSVLGAEVEKEEITEQKTVKEIETNLTNKKEIIKNPTFLQRSFSSPRNTANSIISIIFGLILISLLLNIFIKREHRHVDLVTNGLIALAIIGAIIVSNYYFSYKNMRTVQNFDYSIESSRLK